MSIRTRAQKVIDGEANRMKYARRERIIQAITTILEETELTHIELSIAMGVWAPARNKGGKSMAARWLAGNREPNDQQLATLEQLVKGTLRFLYVARDGRRVLYDLDTVPCPTCDYAMGRFNGVDVCGRCKHSQAAQDDGMLVIDPGRLKEDE